MRPALSRDERQFRDLIENIPALAWSALADGSNTFVSKRWTEYTGLSAEDTAGWGWRAAVHPDDIDRYVEKWRASLASGEPFEDEARIRRAADGEYRWFMARAEPLRDAQGSILNWYGMLTDIEDRKRAEQAQRESEEQWRATFESNPTMYFMVDETGCTAQVNGFGASQLGYEVNELVGQPVLNIFYPPDRENIRKNAERCFQNPGETMQWQARKIRKDGTILWVRESARAVLLKGRPVLLVACEDITERKRIRDELRLSEERFRMLVQFSFDVYWESDENHRFTRQEFGDGLVDAPPRGSEIGKTRWEVPYLEPDEEAWRQHRATMDAHLPFRDFEIARLTPEGGKRYVSVSGVPAFDDNGQFAGYRGVGRDTTRRKRDEAALRQREKELRDLIETIPAIAWTIRADGSNVFANTRWTEYSGLPAQALSGSDWLAAIHPDDLDLHVKKWRVSVTTGVPFENEARLRRAADGEYRWVLVRAMPLRDDGGKVLQWYGVAMEIEDRKRAEQALRRSEAYLSEAQRVTHIGSWACSPTGKSTYWSEEMFRIYGLDPRRGPADGDEFFSRIVHPEDRDRLLEGSEQASRERVEFSLEYRIVQPDGTIRHVHAIGHPVLDKTGELIEYVGTVADVTERKRAEEERAAHLRYLESKDRIHRAIQGTNDLEQMMSDVLDVVLDIFACDRAWLVYPCDPEAPSWRPVMEHTRPEFPGAFAGGADIAMDAEVARAFETVRASGGPVLFGPTCDLQLPAQVAERFGIQSQMAMAVYPKGDKPYLFGLHQCSYPRIWTAQEQELFQSIGGRLADSLTSLLMFRSLRESEAKLEEAQRIAHLGHWERDFATGRLTISDETRRIFGVSPQEATAELAEWIEYWLNLIHPDDRERMKRTLAAAQQSGEPYDAEYRVVRPDGAMRFVQSRGRLKCDESGRPRRMFGMVQDITERKRAEAERIKLEERLQQAEKMEAIGRFASGIAHDFNNVLGGITAYGEMLFDDAPENSPRKRYAQNVLTAATRGRDLVDQILAYTRSQRGKHAPTDVCRIVAETLELVRSSLPASITMYATIPDAPVVVMGNATQLHQIVTNLCSNAIYAMKAGGPLRVAITPLDLRASRVLSHGTLKPGGYVRLSVEDGGCGMDEATLARIFEPFFTTREGGRGTGLGLALVYAIVTGFGGVIDVKSVPDEGSTFSIYMPLPDVPNATVVTAPPEVAGR